MQRTMNFNENLTINNIKASIQYETSAECDIVHNHIVLKGHMTIKESNMQTGDVIEVIKPTKILKADSIKANIDERTGTLSAFLGRKTTWNQWNCDRL